MRVQHMTKKQKIEYYQEQIAFAEAVLKHNSNKHWRNVASRNISLYRAKMSKLAKVGDEE